MSLPQSILAYQNTPINQVLRFTKLNTGEIAADNIACTSLTVNGVDVTAGLTATQNITATPGITNISNLLNVPDVDSTSITTSAIATDTLNPNIHSYVNVGGDLTVSGALKIGTDNVATHLATLDSKTQYSTIGSGSTTFTGLLAADSMSSSGSSSVSTLTVGSTISQTSGTATLKATTVDSLTTSGNITQSGGTATLKASTVDSLATSGNITQSGAGTSTLKATTVDSLSSGGNITQTGGTSTLKATTVDSLTTSGAITMSSYNVRPQYFFSANIASNLWEYTTIPSWVTEFTVVFNYILMGTASQSPLMQLGGASYWTSLYNAAASSITGATAAGTSSTTNIPICVVGSVSYNLHGSITFNFSHSQSNYYYWVYTGSAVQNTSTIQIAGFVYSPVSDPLQKIKIYPTSGNISGTMSIKY